MSSSVDEIDRVIGQLCEIKKQKQINNKKSSTDHLYFSSISNDINNYKSKIIDKHYATKIESTSHDLTSTEKTEYDQKVPSKKELIEEKSEISGISDDSQRNNGQYSGTIRIIQHIIRQLNNCMNFFIIFKQMLKVKKIQTSKIIEKKDKTLLKNKKDDLIIFQTMICDKNNRITTYLTKIIPQIFNKSNVIHISDQITQITIGKDKSKKFIIGSDIILDKSDELDNIINAYKELEKATNNSFSGCAKLFQFFVGINDQLEELND